MYLFAHVGECGESQVPYHRSHVRPGRSPRNGHGKGKTGGSMTDIRSQLTEKTCVLLTLSIINKYTMGHVKYAQLKIHHLCVTLHCRVCMFAPKCRSCKFSARAE